MGASRNPERHWISEPVPDLDPGFTGMMERLLNQKSGINLLRTTFLIDCIVVFGFFE
jgi:hypothetical protein